MMREFGDNVSEKAQMSIYLFPSWLLMESLILSNRVMESKEKI